MQLLSLDEPLSNDDQLALSSKDDLPETFALRRETESEIQALLDELQPDYRAAVVLRYWYDYSYTEIADALNTSESAIKSRLFRARQMLADRLSSQQQRQSNSPQLGDSLRGRNR
jgi:RNA polymerase sigma-70 factor (ECF subfamily)